MGSPCTYATLSLANDQLWCAAVLHVHGRYLESSAPLCAAQRSVRLDYTIEHVTREWNIPPLKPVLMR